MNLHTAAQVLNVLLIVIMFGLGLSMTREDFARVLRDPKGVLVGLVVQVLVLPPFAFALAYALSLPTELAVGLMILAASPGGVSSIIYSNLINGDVALNMTLTGINSLLSAITLPLVTSLAILYFSDENRELGLQAQKMIEVFFIIVIPSSVGMLIGTKFPPVREKLAKPIKILSIAVLFIIIAATVAKEWKMLTDNIGEIGLAVLLFNLLSLGVGYWLPILLKLPERQAAAISLEVGIHNGTLAIYMALSVLENTRMAMPAATYSILMYFTAAGLCYFIKRRQRRMLTASSIRQENVDSSKV